MRSTTLLATVAMVLMLLTAMPMASVAASPTGTTADDTDGTVDGAAIVDAAQTEDNTTNETNETLTPGERLTAIIGVQDAEFEGDIDERAFGLQIANAATNETKAAVIAQNLNRTEERLAALEQRVTELKQQYQDGNISYGQYRSSVAPIYPQIKSLERQLNTSENVSEGLPEDVLRENGINVTAIQTLKTNAQNLSGQDVAEIARSIAGPGTGQGPPVNVPGGPNGGPDMNTTPPENPGAGSPGNGPGADLPGGPGGDDNTTDGNQTVQQLVGGVTEYVTGTLSTIGGMFR